MCEINVYDHADVLNQTVVSRQLKMCQMMKNSFHTFSCNNYPYAVLSSFKDPDKEIIALLRPGFTAAWSSGIDRDEPRRSAQNVVENTTCKGTSGCFSVDCASQSVKHDAGCGGAEKRESAEEEKEESRVVGQSCVQWKTPRSKFGSRQALKPIGWVSKSRVRECLLAFSRLL